MTELKGCFERLGYRNVKTYINSGNVIFSADRTDARALESTIEPALEQAFSFPITVVVRSLAEMEATIADIPKTWTIQANQLRCNVIFLHHTIDDPTIVDKLPVREGVDAIRYTPGAVLWSTKLALITKTSLTKIIGTPLYKGMTIRNINTTRKVYELMQAL
ncbi:MAG TPA: DUF1697 domain-containing protein [Candidatus Saccharimonadales bacterium]|nr:DUF1697 domain-containing protein [Candidatus Saccharimonadales bacterium]